MTCPRCQQSNPVEARYCLGCGSRLALTCGSCGTDLPAGARFCLEWSCPGLVDSYPLREEGGHHAQGTSTLFR
jgi:hypothetical protein